MRFLPRFSWHVTCWHRYACLNGTSVVLYDDVTQNDQENLKGFSVLTARNDSRKNKY